MKSRINISLGSKIHEAAKKYAAARDMDFSELLAYLLRRELESPSLSPDATAAFKTQNPTFAMNPRRFVTAEGKVDFQSPWTLEEWLCRGDIVDNQQLMLVRANMEPGRCHPFHTHPTREELIYIISGRAEQWVGREHRILGPGELAFVPMGEPHGTFNPFRERLVFLAILSPSGAAEPGIVDVSAEEPWATIREGFPPCT